jgi:SAM-dependent methyltransferase
MFSILEQISARPKPFEIYNPEMLWDDDHISKQLLQLHLDPTAGIVSRRSSFLDQSITWLVSQFNISNGTLIADFGCGPGLYATHFALKGAKVTGIDLSRRSIEFAQQTAKKKKLNIKYINQNYFDFYSPQKFNIILMIFCGFCSFGPALQKVILQKFHNQLAEDGVVVLDIYSLNQFNQKEEFSDYEYIKGGGFWAVNDYFGFLNTYKYEAEKVVLDKYTLIEKNNIRTFYSWVQYFSRKSLLKCFEEGGFTIDACYADLTGRPYTDDVTEFAVVARKR